MNHVSAALTIARRELAAYVHAPIAYVVGVLFLALQGLSFWAVVEVLSDPRQPAPLGAVLRGHFGGTFLYWAVLLVVVAAIAMRAVAEDKRQGTWETLLTAPVSEGAVVVGKWLGAVGFFAALQAPTLLYLLVLRAYTPPGVGFDLGPIAAAYLGVLAGGAAFLAVGVAASAATANQIIAAVTTFALLLALLVAGQLHELAPAVFAAGSRARAIVDHVDLRGHMDAFARGAIESGPLLFYAGLVALGLAAAATLAAAGRRRAAEMQGRALATCLIAVIVVLANIVAARHPHTWDVTASRLESLDPRTERVLAAVDEPIDLLVVRPAAQVFDPVHQEIDRLLTRMIRAQPLLARRDLDPALEPDRVAAAAADFAIALDDLIDGGAVIVQRGNRQRAVDLLDMAGFDYDDLGVGAVSRLRAEEALAGALAELVAPDRPTVCFTGGHGEMSPRPGGSAPDWGAIGQRLTRDGFTVEEVGRVAGGVPARCRAVVVAGPLRPLGADDALAIATYLERGGRLLVAARGVGGERGAAAATGLELPLAGLGVRLPAAIVIDPEGEIGLPGAWATSEGYGEHPVSQAFSRRRVTVWLRPRPVLLETAPGRDGQVLVQTSAAGRGERAGGEDLPGPVAIAAAVADEASGARLVVFGGARSLSSEIVDRGLGANDLLVASSLAWLTGRARPVGVGDKTPETVRLIMTDAQRRLVFVLCVLVIPLVFAAGGGVIWWRRRRG